jgi:hypothetical protein
VDWLVDAKVLEKHTVFIIRAEMTMLGITLSLQHDWPFFFRIPFLPHYINPLIPSNVTSPLKMETVCFSKMLISTNQFTWHLNPEEHLHHCHKNIKSHYIRLLGLGYKTHFDHYLVLKILNSDRYLIQLLNYE